MEEALNFILDATEISKGGEVFIPKLLKAYSIMDLKMALEELLGKTGEEFISIRAGEKMHEALLNSDELRYTWEFNDKYIIFDGERNPNIINEKYPGIKKVESDIAYSSDRVKKMSIDEIKKTIIDAGLVEIGKIK